MIQKIEKTTMKKIFCAGIIAIALTACGGGGSSAEGSAGEGSLAGGNSGGGSSTRGDAGGGGSAGGDNANNGSGEGTANDPSTIQNEFTPIIGKTGRIGKGTVQDVKVSKDGKYAYIANGRHEHFAIVSTSDPKNPKVVSSLEIVDADVLNVALSDDGKTAFLGTDEKGIYIIDISDPANPNEIGHYQTDEKDEDGDPFEVLTVTTSKDNTKIYIGYYDFGFEIVDITDKQSPRYLGRWKTADNSNFDVQSITLSKDGEIAYISASRLEGLHIVDVRNPQNPSTKNIIKDSQLLPGDGWWVQDTKVTKDGNTLYVVGEMLHRSMVDVYDISKPDSPKPISTLELQSGVSQIILSEETNRAYVNSNGYEYIDISDPKKLKRVKGFNIYAGGNIDMSQDGKYVYIAADYTGIFVADTSYKNEALLGYLNNAEYSTHDIALSNDGNIAYLALHSDGVMSVGIGDTNNIKTLTTFEHDEFWVTDVQTLKDADQMYASDTKEHYGIKLVDTSVPSHLNILNKPIHTDEYQYRIKGARGIVFAQKRAYIADENDGLKIFDVSDPNDYKLIKVISLGQDEVGSELQAITLSSDLKYAYVLNSKQGLKIVDIDEESETKFEKVGEVKIVDTAYHGMYIHDIAVTPDNKLACITDDSGMLFVVDVSDPTKPKKRGAILGNEEDFHSMKMSEDNKTVYIASGQNGLAVVDISNPDKPKKVGHSTLFGDVYRLEISKDETKAYVIGAGIKLQIVDLTKLR